MNNEQESEAVVLDEEFNPIILPTRMYEFFMANGREGLDAMQLWLHLVYTARRQATNQVWAQNTYLQQGLDLGERKLLKLKSWLHQHGLIEYVDPPRDEHGRYKPGAKRYIRVKASSQSLQSTETAFTAHADTAHAAMQDKCLKEQDKCLKEEGKGDPPPVESKTEEPAKNAELDREAIQDAGAAHGFSSVEMDFKSIGDAQRLASQHGADTVEAALLAFFEAQAAKGKPAKLHWFVKQFDDHKGKAEHKAAEAKKREFTPRIYHPQPVKLDPSEMVDPEEWDSLFANIGGRPQREATG